jgi:hypothetical protein
VGQPPETGLAAVDFQSVHTGNYRRKFRFVELRPEKIKQLEMRGQFLQAVHPVAAQSNPSEFQRPGEWLLIWWENR